MKKSKTTKIQYIRYGAIAVLGVLLLFFVFKMFSSCENKFGRYTEDNSEAISATIDYEGKTYVINQDIETFLLMGIDKFEKDVDNSSYNTDMHADFVVLYVLDNAQQKCTALQISRDTMVDINKLGLNGSSVSLYNAQLSLAYSEGNGGKVSCRNTADSVSSLLNGVKINHYASVTMDTVAILNDLVEGVEVTVLDDFTGIDNTLVKGETVVLKGEQALTYVRSREGMDDSTNNNRMKRQKQYLSALAEKLKSNVASNDKFAVQALQKIDDCLVSDRSVTQLEAFSEKLTSYETELRILEGKSVKGEQFMEFYPDEKLLEKTVVELFYKEQ